MTSEKENPRSEDETDTGTTTEANVYCRDRIAQKCLNC